ncbi:MAG: EamA family transporter, partial [Cyclobacteriaceae bacterium]|nr:EamA family transporter [Cyclobacteriaceae bacterium]
MGYVYIAATVLLTSYGQLILKWRLNLKGSMPDGFQDKMIYLMHTLLDPYVISSFAAAFAASLTWMAALTKFELSTAYPYMSLSFIVVFLFSYWLLGETFTLYKLGGCLL